MKISSRQEYSLMRILSELSICMLLLCMNVAWAQSTTPTPTPIPRTTDPLEKDTDGDGYRDGPDLLLTIDGVLEWRIGEDKNGNGKYEPEGADGILGTKDDEYDPNNPTSHPDSEALVLYSDAASWHDADGDGAVDAEEDVNLNGVYDPFKIEDAYTPGPRESDFQDADTDDDGLRDGFEMGGAETWELPFTRAMISPTLPDSDFDGMPDGLELGVTKPVQPYGFCKGTNPDATFTTHAGEVRSCFIVDMDPGSITDPIRPDTNLDGINDIDSDKNINGKYDPLGTDGISGTDDDETEDAAAGFFSCEEFGFGDLTFYYSNTIRIIPVRDENDILDEDSVTYWINYQATSDTEIPNVIISNPNALTVDSIEKMKKSDGSDTRFWKITLKVVNVETSTQVSIQSNALHNGSTASMYYEITKCY